MSMDSVGTRKQPAPLGDGRDVTELVLQDLRDRSAAGTKKYGSPLRAHNGRDALVDAYQEALDLVCYLRQAIEEAPRAGTVVSAPGAANKVREILMDPNVQKAINAELGGWP